MLERLLRMRTYKEFLAVSADLVKSSNRMELYQEIAASGIPMCVEDKLLGDEITDSSVSESRIENHLNSLDGRPLGVRIVQSLQLMAGVNPGIRQHIEQYLTRACI